jgi:predicted enzyme related to lactoylglutathione lyase
MSQKEKVKRMIKTVWGITFYVTNLQRAAKFYEEILLLWKRSMNIQAMLVLNVVVLK